MQVRQYSKMIILEIIMFIVLLLNVLVFHFFTNTVLSILFLAVFLGMFIYLKGFEKEKSIHTIDISFQVLSCMLCYFMIIYVLGIWTGYAKTVYSLTFFNILGNVIPNVLIIVLAELLRYTVVSKVKGGKGERLVLGLLFGIFFLFDCRMIFAYGPLTLDQFSTIILPSIAREILLFFFAYYVGYKSTILYRFLHELPIYIVPIYPNLGPYITGIIDIVLPFMVWLVTKDSILKKREFYVRSEFSLVRATVGVVFGTFLLCIVLLTSGYFKYYALGVVSNSMKPEISRGDVVIVQKASASEKKDIEVGEILVYQYNEKTVVHRVVGKTESSNGYIYRTKGDNNDDEDNLAIYEKNIIGTAKYKIPIVGYPSIWFKEWREK